MAKRNRVPLIATSIRLPADVHKALVDLAVSLDSSGAEVAVRFIRQSLQELGLVPSRPNDLKVVNKAQAK